MSIEFILLAVNINLVSFSIFLGGEDDGSPQWGVWVRIGGKRRYVYIGTVNEVSYHLDLIENNVPHYNKNNRYEDGVVGFYGKLNPTNQNEGDLLMSEDFDIIKSKNSSSVSMLFLYLSCQSSKEPTKGS